MVLFGVYHRILMEDPGTPEPGIDFEVEWHPLDQNGKRPPPVKVPDDTRIKYGGYTNVFASDGFKQEVIPPPFEHPHGWEVTITIGP